MSHRNYLSRRDLYPYGLKEGEAWGDDRRELEVALWEMDQLERRMEYGYQEPSPSHPWTCGRSSVWRPSHSSGSPSNECYHDVQITRSNSDLQPIFESGMTSLSSRSHARYSDDSTSFDGYQRGHAHRTYPSSHAVPSVFRGYPSNQSSTVSRDYQSPGYTSSLRPPSNSNYQNFHGSVGFSHSSDHRNHGFAPSMTHSTSYGPSHHSQYSSQHSPVQRISTSQLQMVTRRNGRNGSPNPQHTVDPRHASATPALPNIMSPHWSMIATEGTATSESLSVIPSGGMYSQNSSVGYVSTASHDSGCIESFDVHSHDEFYDSDEGYISDGVASDDAGYYCSSESDPEESWGNFSEGSDDFYGKDEGNPDYGSD